MKINREDFKDILGYLETKRSTGEEYIAFPDSPAAVYKDKLPAFLSLYDAQEYCYEMSTDRDRYDYLSIRSVYAALAEAVENENLMIEKDGVVDVGLMVFKRYETLPAAQLFNNQNSIIVNQKNFEYLKDQVKYTGFGDALENDLKKMIEAGQPDFKLQYQTKYGNDSVTAALNFSRSKQSDMYFFNAYQVNLQKENSAEKMEQTFYINKGNNITLKEAYNLMEGRSVNKDLTNKEGLVYNAWIQMDFKQSDDNGNFKLKHFHQNYGYDLDAVLSKHPIKELTNADFKDSLMDSLKKGNLQSVTFLINGTEQKQYIEANPQFKTINIYDKAMQRLESRHAKKEQQSESEGQSARQDNKNERQSPAEDDGPEVPEASKSRRRNQGISS